MLLTSAQDSLGRYSADVRTEVQGNTFDAEWAREPPPSRWTERGHICIGPCDRVGVSTGRAQCVADFTSVPKSCRISNMSRN